MDIKKDEMIETITNWDEMIETITNWLVIAGFILIMIGMIGFMGLNRSSLFHFILSGVALLASIAYFAQAMRKLRKFAPFGVACWTIVFAFNLYWAIWPIAS